ncbi:UDP-glucose/GDP-mannose dehydrogenase family protein [Paenibacillus chitinolyticus]|uniref:UDP-glucose 6-dehydrogenase n=1 Tax=Paenibacillus chitinolyticus TaxID=79263 RepID=A0A410X0U9_9BACL|nr:UDP-glucose/GDP-mannose dehydrogenase family protein [Paenibacillus chitinolyticus]MCY9588476.1 UDP-glucose/GDP-mannose dehydrogenase family protein [Paenibacillus chitinolyticus]MCY9597846.1 UDP-glucose/GDP-mannose dehydrogenase family protein [Paenibacillus chitinolyticus]QAV20227.1 UDP-glucose/GDP-mannose dehydrogenase family protein [Paenibacillus chitinolyticus]
MERIAVIGTGYVGLVTGCCYAEIGHEVICVDIDPDKVRRLSLGEIPIYEPGLGELAASNQAAGRLSFTTDLARAVQDSSIIFIAVGTPTLENGEVDMQQVRGAVETLARQMNDYKIIVMKSTVPVGTSRRIRQWMEEGQQRPVPFSVVSNPEFLREGTAIHDTFHPDRVVIGSDDADAALRVERLQAAFGGEVVRTDPESAELIKYASNAFLAAKISFINEMANVCEKVGADVSLVARGMGLDNRIGPKFLQAGIGYGGSCFPKDTRAQLKIAQNADYDFRILRAVIEVNTLQRERFVEKVTAALGGNATGRSITVWGLAFKPNTDDLRDAPALDIIRALQERGAVVTAYDPAAASKASALLPGVRCLTDPYEAAENAEAVVIATDWEDLRRIDFDRLRSLVRKPLIIDGRNMFAPAEMAEKGFTYVSVGRPAFPGPV